MSARAAAPARAGIVLARSARARMTVSVALAAMRYRASQLAVAALAVLLGSALPATVIGLGSVRDRFDRELAVHGANVFVVPRGGLSLDEPALRAVLDRLVAEGGVDVYAPRLILPATADGRRVAGVGTPLDTLRRLSPSWEVVGTWPDEAAAVLLGANLAAKLGRRPGDTLSLGTSASARRLRVAGIVRTGGQEDDRVFLDLDVARALAPTRDRVSLVHVRARSVADLPAVAGALERALPGAEARTPVEAARTTETVLARLQHLLGLVAAAVVLVSALSVFAMMAAVAAERGSEVAVMKAIGASSRWVGALALAEAGVVGMLGSVAGFGLGVALTEVIAWQVFGVTVPPTAMALLASVAVGAGVTLAAAAGPIRRVVRLTPAAVLRGE